MSSAATASALTVEAYAKKFLPGATLGVGCGRGRLSLGSSPCGVGVSSGVTDGVGDAAGGVKDGLIDGETDGDTEGLGVTVAAAEWMFERPIA